MNTEPSSKKNHSILAENLRFLLEKNKVTISQLAEVLHLPIMTIRRLVTGETTDPRFSTLRQLAEYFDVSVDFLFKKSLYIHRIAKNNETYIIPVLDWGLLKNIDSFTSVDLSNWQKWQPVSIPFQQKISSHAFALESRPSMAPRFPNGTLFIIDPEISPEDGDFILIKLKQENDIALKELIIDPPHRYLKAIMLDSPSFSYSKSEHEIIGVVILTLFFNRKNL